MGSIEKLNPDCYRKYEDKIGHDINAANRSHQLPKLERFQVSNFDLKGTIEKCLTEIIANQPLVGLSVRCDDSSFRRHFGDRLEKALGQKNTKTRPPISLDSKHNSIDSAVEKIIKCQSLLEKFDVIYPVIVNISESNSTSIEDFWVKIYNSFTGEFDRKLIVVIFGSKDCILPSNVMLLDSPTFNSTHAFEWFVEVAEAVELPAQQEWETAIKVWKQKMIEFSRCEHSDLDLLEVNLVYYYLHDTLHWIQKNQSLSIEDFVDYLKS